MEHLDVCAFFETYIHHKKKWMQPSFFSSPWWWVMFETIQSTNNQQETSNTCWWFLKAESTNWKNEQVKLNYCPVFSGWTRKLCNTWNHLWIHPLIKKCNRFGWFWSTICWHGCVDLDSCAGKRWHHQTVINHRIHVPQSKLLILGMVIPPLIGILIMGIQTPTIRLMTIPTIGKQWKFFTPAHMNCWSWIQERPMHMHRSYDDNETWNIKKCHQFVAASSSYSPYSGETLRRLAKGRTLHVYIPLALCWHVYSVMNCSCISCGSKLIDAVKSPNAKNKTTCVVNMFYWIFALHSGQILWRRIPKNIQQKRLATRDLTKQIKWVDKWPEDGQKSFKFMAWGCLGMLGVWLGLNASAIVWWAGWSVGVHSGQWW